MRGRDIGLLALAAYLLTRREGEQAPPQQEGQKTGAEPTSIFRKAGAAAAAAGIDVVVPISGGGGYAPPPSYIGGAFRAAQESIMALIAEYPPSVPPPIAAVNWALWKARGLSGQNATNLVAENIIPLAIANKRGFWMNIAQARARAYYESKGGMATARPATQNLFGDKEFMLADEIRSAWFEQWHLPASRVPPSALGSSDFNLAAKIMLGLVDWRSCIQLADIDNYVARIESAENAAAWKAGIGAFDSIVGTALGAAGSKDVASLFSASLGPANAILDNDIAAAKGWSQYISPTLTDYPSFLAACRRRYGIDQIPDADDGAYAYRGDIATDAYWVVGLPAKPAVDLNPSSWLPGYFWGLANMAPRFWDLHINCAETTGFGWSPNVPNAVEAARSWMSSGLQFPLYQQARTLRALDILCCQVWPDYTRTRQADGSYRLATRSGAALYSWRCKGVTCIGSIYPPTSDCEPLNDLGTEPKPAMSASAAFGGSGVSKATALLNALK